MFKKTPQTGTIINRYRVIEEFVENWLKCQKLSISKFNSKDVHSRLKQRIVDITADAFTKDLIDRGGVNVWDHSNDLRNQCLNGVSINVSLGTLKFSRLLILKGFVEFFSFWVIFLISVIRGILFSKKAINSNFSLFLDFAVDKKEKIEDFKEFCDQGPIVPLRDIGTLLVKGNFPNKVYDKLIFDNLPLAYALSKLTPRKILFKILILHLFTPFVFLFLLLKNRYICLLGQDLALMYVLSQLDKAELITNAFITVSRFKSQPLWLKGLKNQSFKLHLIWYSQNIIPKVYKAENVKSSLPFMKYMRVDCHWVWTVGFRDFLISLGQNCAINAVGPITFYLPKEINKYNDVNCLVLFDIKPVLSEKGIPGVAENYYTLSLMKKFIEDTLEIVSELKKENNKDYMCLLKQKRKSSAPKKRDEYTKFLDEMLTKHKHFQIIDEDTNLYGLIEECKLSLAIPYTTTCAVAAELGKPSAYYDPFSVLIPTFEPLTKVEFINNRHCLKKFINTHM